MSADLLAEFGQGSAPARSSLGTQQTTKQSQPPANPLIDDFDQSDDIFFGRNSNPQPLANRHQLDPFSSNSNSNTGQYEIQAPAVHQQMPNLPKFDLPRQNDSDILFDATEDTPTSEGEDDWGDFEGPEASPAQPQQSHPTPVAREAKGSISTPQPPASNGQQVHDPFDLLDSLSIDDRPSDTRTSSVNLGNKSPLPAGKPAPDPTPTWEDDSFGDWGEFTDTSFNAQNAPSPQASKSTNQTTPKLKPKPKSPPKKSQTSTKPTPQEPAWDDDAFDDWGDFNDGPTQAPSPAPAPAQKSTPTSPPPDSFTSGNAAPSSTVRPTNIPPPSVLLELLVDLMNNLQKEAATASKTAHQETTDQSNTATATKVHTTLSTAARIIAGRTLRWKRDTILSQSMRIGPARAGKSSGMKLSAVNKHEDVKEEQDAVDVLSLWRERAALFNAVVQAAGLRPIPTVASPAALKVITAKQGQGALKATHACALCALKRDERVLRVDEENVQDSFGEWWTDHWGHTGCRLFWEENRGMLGQR